MASLEYGRVLWGPTQSPRCASVWSPRFVAILPKSCVQVTLLYRETDTGRWRTCQLAAEQFIHRFLQHVLPRGFVKVRYYGLFAPGNRQHLTTVKQQINEAITCEPKTTTVLNTTTSEPPTCSHCGQPMRLFKHVLVRPWHPP